MFRRCCIWRAVSRRNQRGSWWALCLNSHRLISKLNSSFQSRPFFVGGESYGGKYVPALGYYIMLNTQRPTFLTQKQPHECSDQDRVSFRLDGLFIGNGLTHPVVQVQTHGDTAYNFGLIDRMQKNHVDHLAEEVIVLIEKEEFGMVQPLHG